MDSHCFPASELPGASKLFAAYLSDFSRLEDFYRLEPSWKSVRKATRSVAIPVATREAVAHVLREQNVAYGSDTAVLANITRLAEGAFAVVTGQQVGLLTGPAYSVHKAVTAIAVARKLSQQGIPAVPIFWMASEDHDLAEVAHTDWLHAGGIESLRVEADADEAGRSVGEVRLGGLAAQVAGRVAGLLEGPAADEIARAVHAALRPDATFASQFAQIFARVFQGHGLILLDPSAGELHRLALPVLRSAIRERAGWSRLLLERGKQLERKNFHVQVKVTPPSTTLFVQVDGKRQALRQRGDSLIAGDASFAEGELLAHIESYPERFSGNALLRPIIQDSLLPTVAFIAGPAEIAYLAQSAVLYREASVNMPVVLPRASFTLVEPHIARLLRKYGLDVKDVFIAAPAFRRRLERHALPAGLAKRFAQGEKDLAGYLKKLAPALGKVDKTLLGASATAERKVLFQLGKLRDKAARAHAFRAGVLDRHEHSLRNALFPHQQPQERTLNFLPFLARHGLALLDELESRASDTGKHHVLFL